MIVSRVWLPLVLCVLLLESSSQLAPPSGPGTVPLAGDPALLPGQPAPLPGQPAPLPGQPAPLPGQPAPLPGQPASLPGQPAPPPVPAIPEQPGASAPDPEEPVTPLPRPNFLDDEPCPTVTDESKVEEGEEVAEEIRCLQVKDDNGKKVNRFKCVTQESGSTEEASEVVTFNLNDGIKVKVCFVNKDKKGTKDVPIEEIGKLIDFPIVCDAKEEEGEMVLASYEYRCFWDECNKKIELALLEAACKEKLIDDGIMERQDDVPTSPITSAATGTTVAVTTPEPAPIVRGSEDYFEFDGVHNHDHDDYEDDGHNATETKAVADHQLTIALGIVLTRLL